MRKRTKKKTEELTPRIIRNLAPNLQCLELKVNIRISNYHFEDFDLPLQEREEAKCLKKVGPIGAELVRKIDRILGCESVTLNQYGVTVYVGDAFNPNADGITDAVIEALKDCFGNRRDEVEVITKATLRSYRENPHDPLFGGEITM